MLLSCSPSREWTLRQRIVFIVAGRLPTVGQGGVFAKLRPGTHRRKIHGKAYGEAKGAASFRPGWQRRARYTGEKPADKASLELLYSITNAKREKRSILINSATVLAYNIMKQTPATSITRIDVVSICLHPFIAQPFDATLPPHS